MKPTMADIQTAIPGLPATPPQHIDGGQNARVLDFGTHIVRIPRYPEHEMALDREAVVLARIGARLPIPTPHITTYRIDGTTVAVHRKIAGEPLWAIDADRAPEAAASLGSFLLALHAVPVPSVTDLDLPVMDRTFWIDLMQQASRHLATRLSRRAYGRFDRLADRFLANIGTLPFVVRHGDFGAGNILSHDGRVTGIIDFGGVTIGDPAADVAGLAASYGASFLDLVARSYPHVREMHPRIAFYRSAFAAMEAMHGLDHDDPAALAAGLESLEGAT